jgi:hypothetical protein
MNDQASFSASMKWMPFFEGKEASFFGAHEKL